MFVQVADNQDYLVSDQGQIVSLKGGAWKAVVGTPNGHGYLQVALYRNGRRVRKLIHRLVSEAFLGPCPKGREVNHKNGNGHDNRLENLEYCTPKENTRHAWARGLAKPYSRTKKSAPIVTDAACESRLVSLQTQPQVSGQVLINQTESQD